MGTRTAQASLQRTDAMARPARRRRRPCRSRPYEHGSCREGRLADRPWGRLISRSPESGLPAPDIPMAGSIWRPGPPALSGRRSTRRSGLHAGPLHRPRQRGGRAARRPDRRRRRGAHDADADPAVRGEAVDRDLKRPGGRGGHAAGRGRRAPAEGHGQPEAGRLDGARVGADGVRSAPICCTSGQRGAATQSHVETALGTALLVGAGAMALRYVLDLRGGHRRRRRGGRCHRAAAGHRGASAWSAG